MQACAERANRRAAPAEHAEGACQQLHDRGLAIGAGDAGNAQVPRRIAKESRRDRTQFLAQAIDAEHIAGNDGLRDCRSAFGEHDAGATGECRGSEADAMFATALQGDEGIAGGDSARIKTEPAHDDIGKAAAVGVSGQQVVEAHGRAHGTASS